MKREPVELPPKKVRKTLDTTIGDALDAEDVVCDRGYSPPEGGQRRSYVEQYYHSVDWRNRSAVGRALRVFAGVLMDLEQTGTEGAQRTRARLLGHLQRDGIHLNDGRLACASAPKIIPPNASSAEISFRLASIEPLMPGPTPKTIPPSIETFSSNQFEKESQGFGLLGFPCGGALAGGGPLCPGIASTGTVRKGSRWPGTTTVSMGSDIPPPPVPVRAPDHFELHPQLRRSNKEARRRHLPAVGGINQHRALRTGGVSRLVHRPNFLATSSHARGSLHARYNARQCGFRVRNAPRPRGLLLVRASRMTHQWS